MSWAEVKKINSNLDVPLNDYLTGGVINTVSGQVPSFLSVNVEETMLEINTPGYLYGVSISISASAANDGSNNHATNVYSELKIDGEKVSSISLKPAHPTDNANYSMNAQSCLYVYGMANLGGNNYYQGFPVPNTYGGILNRFNMMTDATTFNFFSDYVKDKSDKTSSRAAVYDAALSYLSNPLRFNSLKATCMFTKPDFAIKVASNYQAIQVLYQPIG